jgi:uncharacterized protein (DUF1800 family)
MRVQSISALGLAFGLGTCALTAQTARVVNLSTRAFVGTGTNVTIAGFVVGPGSGETLLIRAVGPGLYTTFPTAFQPGQVLAHPSLSLFDSSKPSPLVVASDTGWGNAPVTGTSPAKATVQQASAASMASVGAFALASGSADSAMVVNLPPGAYTAVVAGADGGQGVALVEIYDMGAAGDTSSLSNISSRVFVGTGIDAALPGFVIAGSSGTRQLLMRAVGPGLLSTFQLAGALTDPTIKVTDSASGTTVYATNDDWGSPVGSGAADAATLGQAFDQAGAFSLSAGSKDSAALVSLPPGHYGLQVSGNGGATGIALVEIYDLTPPAAPSAAIAATDASADTSGGNPGVFTVSRSGDTSQPLAVNYTVAGTAINGTDYEALPGVVVIPAGSSSATITVSPNPNLSSSTASTVILTLAGGPGYSIGGSASATVTISDLPATLYVATLRPPAGATNSTASGTATILLNPDGTIATVTVSFSNLSSGEVTAHLVLGVPGNNSTFVFGLPYGQVSGSSWTFDPVASFSSADLLAALKAGGIYVEIDTENYSTGELSGQFIPNSGTSHFTPPADPPAIDLSSPTANDAARFLTQATFGPTTAGIADLTARGYDAWIAGQMALPPTSHLAATRADAAAFPNSGQYAIVQNNRQEAWWSIAVTAPDQLRQRMAFALSQIFVVSDAASSLAQQPEALANYYDMLASEAFGNFRQLLQDVTLSPVMGNYLNMLRNAPANPSKGTAADENYAREVMQLFTIGLNQLNPDGTLALGATGQPIPTYDNDTIVQTANVLTGWAYYSTAANPNFKSSAADWYDPMMLYPAYHDNTAKTIVGGLVLPANEGGAADLKAELDALFNHPNTGPFICRELIQRLVTSNPSPGYVYRVAKVFANDGTGARGNLGAVVKAILLDYEARSPSLVGNAGTGRLKEPLLRETALLRAFNASAQNGRFAIFSADKTLGQAALRSPTVFNFFLPDYVPPGVLAAAGLYAPEFQITTDSALITATNTLYSAVYTSASPSASTLVLDLSPLTSSSGNTSTALVSTLNTLFCGGAMSAAMQQKIVDGLASLPKSASALDRARFALELTITSPEGAVQQ